MLACLQEGDVMVSTINRPNRFSRSASLSKSLEKRTSIAPFHSELNWMAIAWRDDVLNGNVFGYPSQRLAELALARFPGMTESFFRFVPERQASALPPWVERLVDKLRRFAEGEPVDFPEVPLALDHLTSFGRHVVAACRRIPWGQTRTYGELAAECGAPGAARAVGSVMAKNRYPLIVPCHRVLAAGGQLGGYSAPEGLAMKRRLLAMESGVAVRQAASP
jgi:methylated-DNA-[protein]-cysteine S-methyltransferase